MPRGHLADHSLHPEPRPPALALNLGLDGFEFLSENQRIDKRAPDFSGIDGNLAVARFSAETDGTTAAKRITTESAAIACGTLAVLAGTW